MAKGGAGKGGGGKGGRGDQPRDREGQFASKGAGGGSMLMAAARRVGSEGSVSGRRVDRARMRLRTALDRVEKRRAEAEASGTPKATNRLRRSERSATALSKDLQRVLSKPIARPSGDEQRAKAQERIVAAKKRLVTDADERRLKLLRNRLREGQRRGLEVDTNAEMRQGKALLGVGVAKADYRNAKWQANNKRDRILSDLARGTSGGVAKWTPAQRDALMSVFKADGRKARSAPRSLLREAIRAARESLK